MMRAAMVGFRARPGEVLGRRYRLVQLLGEGGMGEVWEATQLGLERSVAVKILKARFAQMGEVLVRFKREAQVTAGLGHPNMVEVLDFVCEPGQPAYLVMEMLSGQSLASALAERGRLAWPVAVRVAVDVLGALAAAHAAGVVHRDIKPANIWLEGDLNEPRVKVLDFGVAQIADEGGPKLTRTNTTVGTPQYLPPEQIAGSRVDARADLWAVGVTLYETLAGRPAFIGGDFAALVGAILTSEPPRLETLLPDLPPALVHTVHAALSKEPQGRPSSAGLMAAALRELSGGIARDHTDNAFAATMLPDQPAVSPQPPRGYDATKAAVPGGLLPAGVGAIDSSPGLPQTRHQPPKPASAPGRGKFGQAVILSGASGLDAASLGGTPEPVPAHTHAQVAPNHAPLSLAEDEPVVLPQRMSGRWLWAGLGFVLLGGLVLIGVIVAGRRPSNPDLLAELHPPTPRVAVSPPARVAVPSDVAADAGRAPLADLSSPSFGVQARAVNTEAANPAIPRADSSAQRANHVGARPPGDSHTPAHETVAPPTPNTMAPNTMAPNTMAPNTMADAAHDPPRDPPAQVAVVGTTERSTSEIASAVPTSTAAPTMRPTLRAGGRASHLHRRRIGGSYDGYAARAHIGAAESAANRCVARMHPPVGTAQYRVTVPPNGAVRTVTGGDPIVARCLERAFGIINWTAPTGGAAQSVTVTYEALP